MPKGNSAYWKPKIFGNKRRDGSVTRDLRRAGWSVLRVWEHDLAPKHQKRLSGRIRQALQ